MIASASHRSKPQVPTRSPESVWTPPPPHYVRGFGLLHSREVTQANDGCDYRVLEGAMPTPEPEIH